MKRYEPYSGAMEDWPRGDWVKYTDHISEIERYQKALEEMGGLVFEVAEELCKFRPDKACEWLEQMEEIESAMKDCKGAQAASAQTSKRG